MVGTKTARGKLISVLPEISLEQGRPLALQSRFAPADEVSFRIIAGRNVLFSTTTQSLVEINDTAAYIWRSIEDGLEREAILNEMVGQGLDPETADSYFATALLEWTRLGFLKPLSQPASFVLPEKALRCQDICVAGVQMRVRHASSLASDIAPIFEHLEIKGMMPDLTIDVVDHNERIDLLLNSNWLLSCPRKELATILKGQLLDEVLERATYELALHAATLVRNGRALLVSGHPGAGKTTLTLALVDAGFGFAGDDLALLNSEGQVIGIPFAPAVKAGAWTLIATYRPDIRNTLVFRRPDGIRVRYPAPRGLAPAIPYRTGWFVLLDRRSSATATLTPVDPLSAVRWMLQEAYTPDRRLTTNGFKAVGHAVNGAEYYRLTYSQLEDAVELLHQACQ